MKSVPRPIPVKGEDTGEVRRFFDGWGLYWRVVDRDYLSHKEVYTRLNDFLKAHFQKPFTLIDLGCGDSSYMVRGLAGTKISRYIGIDLTAAALRLARENLTGLGYETTFIAGDFIRLLRKQKTGAEVVWACLSIHHLSLEQKHAFFKDCRGALGRGGYLLIYEPVLKPGEARPEYLARFREITAEQWKAVTRREMEEVVKHVSGADFPESLATFETLARENGFGETRFLFHDPNELYSMLCFSVGAQNHHRRGRPPRFTPQVQRPGRPGQEEAQRLRYVQKEILKIT
ncbi:MAG: class I SAM-dependent methyltransferase [PVC group bacterium]